MGGNSVLCDLQGSWTKTEGIILTDPVVMSRQVSKKERKKRQIFKSF
jgi:hypothetical protein